MTPLFWVMTPFFKGHGDSRYGSSHCFLGANWIWQMSSWIREPDHDLHPCYVHLESPSDPEEKGPFDPKISWAMTRFWVITPFFEGQGGSRYFLCPASRSTPFSPFADSRGSWGMALEEMQPEMSGGTGTRDETRREVGPCGVALSGRRR